MDQERPLLRWHEMLAEALAAAATTVEERYGCDEMVAVRRPEPAMAPAAASERAAGKGSAARDGHVT